MGRKSAANKHPLWIRWAHWINFPVLLIMMWSGAMIYWANHVYWPHFSDPFFNFLNLKHRLAEGMSYHFFFMWIFAINGILYFFYLLFSREWKEVCPFISAGKYSTSQRIAYSAIIIMGFGSLLTGLAIYKPVQLSWLETSLGGYETARLIHFYLTLGFILFIFIHVTQVIRAGWKNFSPMISPFHILWLCFFVVGFSWLINQMEIDSVPRPLRQVMELNESIWKNILNPENIDHPSHKDIVTGQKGKVNGDIGLNSTDDLKSWTITVSTNMSQSPPKEVSISLDDIKKLKSRNLVTQLKCIEGWSEVRSYEGIPFVDFLNHYGLGTHSGNPVDFKNHPEDLFSYVGLETPDGEYYVSIDMKSMLSPDTLLAFEMNGAPLAKENGAPVRLAISNKYGVKNLKRIGQIHFADFKLPDYWGEQGYDWFIGL